MPKRKEVDDWFAEYDSPLKPAMLRVREIILAADPRMDECIKWKTPTFTFDGNLASFHPRSKKAVSLLFHTGAHLPGTHPRLSGGGDTARYMNLTDLNEANAAKPDVESIVSAWCASRTNPPSKAPGTSPASSASPEVKPCGIATGVERLTGRTRARRGTAARVVELEAGRATLDGGGTGNDRDDTIKAAHSRCG